MQRLGDTAAEEHEEFQPLNWVTMDTQRLRAQPAYGHDALENAIVPAGTKRRCLLIQQF